MRVTQGIAGSSALLIAVIGLYVLSPAIGIVSYVILAAYSFLGRAQVLQVLGLSWLLTMLNPGLAPEASLATVGRYLVLFAAAASLLLRSGFGRQELRASRLAVATLFLGSYLVVHAMIFSPMKDVSILKAVSWTMAATTILAAWRGLDVQSRGVLARHIFGVLVMVMLASLPLMLTSTGYHVNGTGFQGVLNHPQAFGPTMALLGVWAASRVFAEPKPSIPLMAVVALCAVMVIVSEARTAAFAAALGLTIGAAVVMGMTGHRVSAILPGLASRKLHLVVLVCGSVILLSTSPLLARLESFISKRTDHAGVVAAYDASRGVLIDRMWANIQSHPWQGIGFGIASDPLSMKVEREPVLGLPTGAVIEKGVLPLAVLEEIGIVGFLLVGAWLWILLRRAAVGGGLPAVAVCVTALLINMGESVLFSPGGLGLLVLLLLGWAATETRIARRPIAND